MALWELQHPPPPPQDPVPPVEGKMILDSRGGWATDISVKSRAAAAIEFRQHVLSE